MPTASSRLTGVGAGMAGQVGHGGTASLPTGSSPSSPSGVHGGRNHGGTGGAGRVPVSTRRQGSDSRSLIFPEAAAAAAAPAAMGGSGRTGHTNPARRVPHRNGDFSMPSSEWQTTTQHQQQQPFLHQQQQQQQHHHQQQQQQQQQQQEQFSAGALPPLPAPEDEAALEEEWNVIEAQTQEMRIREGQDRGRIRAQEDILSKPLSWPEVQQWLLREVVIDQSVLENLRKEEVFETGCITCIGRRRSLLDVPGLDRKLAKDKDLVMYLQATNFDFNQITHFRMLKTTYMKLTRNKVCPSIGGHWEVLGFQHTDPRTDLNRSGGILNVLHLFYFFTHHFDILKSAYLLAQDVEQNFPLACISINMTRMVLDFLLQGKLSSLCNGSDKGVLDTTCRVYSGAFYHFYSRWRALKRTIRDTEVTFNEVRKLLEKSPKKLVEGLAKGVEEMKAKSDPSRFEFTDLDFSSRAPAAAAAGGAAAAPKAAPTLPSVPRRLRNYHEGQ